jgi:phospholipase C
MVDVRFANTGRAAAVFHVRSGDANKGPWTYTVGAGAEITDALAIDSGDARYDLSVYGPNGFFRAFKGTLDAPLAHANLAVRALYDAEGGIALEVRNRSTFAARVTITESYSGRSHLQHLEPERVLVWRWSLDGSHGWYDLTIEVAEDATYVHRLAGHVETGRPSASDPAFARFGR